MGSCFQRRLCYRLYDNPQIAQTYLSAFQATGDRGFARVARGVLDYLLRDMQHPEGGFYSAEVVETPFAKSMLPRLKISAIIYLTPKDRLNAE